MFILIIISFSGCNSKTVSKDCIEVVKMLERADYRFENFLFTAEEYNNNKYKEIVDSLVASTFEESSRYNRHYKPMFIDYRITANIDELTDEALEEIRKVNKDSVLVEISGVYDSDKDNIKYVYTRAKITNENTFNGYINYITRRYMLIREDNQWKIAGIEQALYPMANNKKLEEMRLTKHNNQLVNYEYTFDPLTE